VSIGLLGGTFDPVHNAHLEMARSALAHLALGQLLFIPTGTPPYRKPPLASAEDRVAMLELALAGEPRFRIDKRELAPGASGYTVDTLRALRAELGGATRIYFLMGADQYAKLASWRHPEEVRRLASIAVFARPGFAVPKEGVETVPLVPMAISASEVRARAARAKELAGLVPEAVANYIRTHRLYS
jgi:nicotinate-nucleotide adenylyltransferase